MESDLVLRMAIRRAWGVERGPLRGPIVFVTGSRGEYLDNTMLSKIDDALREAFRFETDADIRHVAAELPPLNTSDQNAELSLVVLSDFPSSEIITRLRQRYPEFVFLVSGTRGGPAADHIDLGKLKELELYHKINMLLEYFHLQK